MASKLAHGGRHHDGVGPRDVPPWGPERTFLYNDAYAPMLGCAPSVSIRRTVRGRLVGCLSADRAAGRCDLAGETSTFHDMPLTMTRNGYPEETWWTFSYSPVRDEQGDVAGLLNVTLETTERHQIEQQRDEAVATSRRNEAKWRRLF